MRFASGLPRRLSSKNRIYPNVEALTVAQEMPELLPRDARDALGVHRPDDLPGLPVDVRDRLRHLVVRIDAGLLDPGPEMRREEVLEVLGSPVQ